MIAWYHKLLLHPGMTRLYGTISQYFTRKNLKKKIETFVGKCSICQKCKKPSKKYGKLLVKTAQAVPWNEMNVDLVGPLTVVTPHEKLQLQCLTIIDPATYWLEIINVINKTVEHCAKLLDRV